MLKKLFYLSLVSIFLSSCSSVYLPSVPNTPLLSEQGELSMAVHGSLNKNININAAYALGTHFAFISNYNSMHMDRERKDINHKAVELGAGYYGKLGEAKDQIIEIYGGFGRARNDRSFFERGQTNEIINTSTEKAKYDKKFIQVNYSSMKTDNLRLFGKPFDLNFGTAFRVNFVKTDELFIDGIKQTNEDNVFLEPIFFTTLALSDNFKIQYSNGSNFGLKSRDFLNANNSIFSLGLVYTFKPKKN